jgi:hypothetical protein
MSFWISTELAYVSRCECMLSLNPVLVRPSSQPVDILGEAGERTTSAGLHGMSGEYCVSRSPSQTSYVPSLTSLV